VDFLWLDNSNSDKSLIFQEAYSDNKNSPYSIIDNVDIDVSTNDSAITLGCTSFHKAKWTASNGIYKEDQIDIDSDNDSNLKKKRIDLRANVTVPGPVERQHD